MEGGQPPLHPPWDELQRRETNNTGSKTVTCNAWEKNHWAPRDLWASEDYRSFAARKRGKELSPAKEGKRREPETTGQGCVCSAFSSLL